MKNDSPPMNRLASIWQHQQTEGIHMSAEDLRRRAKKFQRTVSWRNAREYIAAVVVVVFFGLEFWRTNDILTRVGFALMIAGLVYLVWQLRRKGSSLDLPAESGLQSDLAFFKGQLERQRALLQGVWRWYLGPVIPGWVVLTVAFARTNPGHLPYFALVLTAFEILAASFFIFVWRLNQRAANRLQRQIEELDSLQGP